ncbi:hypothetical protein LOAG_07215 [Loa loa]|uniref:Transcriptional regulator n=1 Tax=Loa loa TaxID=7209 RepID=A0A1I7V936_LOALO|nr:hypothetical protein LOAG_07215 [Loa loa]EFO21275.1 hypothetical protein LOAG_07215 [Loa loa]
MPRDGKIRPHINRLESLSFAKKGKEINGRSCIALPSTSLHLTVTGHNAITARSVTALSVTSLFRVIVTSADRSSTDRLSLSQETLNDPRFGLTQ